MSLTIVSAPVWPQIRSLPGKSQSAEDETLKFYRQRQRVSVTLKSANCCAFCSASPPQEADAASSSSSSSSSSATTSSASDLASFKPPPPLPPVTPNDLPFQYWYSYSDLPPGIPKKRPKTPYVGALTEESRVKQKSKGKLDPPSNLDKKGGRTGGRGTLWEAVLAADAAEAETTFNRPKEFRRGRGVGGNGGLRASERRLSSRNSEEKGVRGGATAAALQVDEYTLSEEGKKELLNGWYDGRSNGMRAPERRLVPKNSEEKISRGEATAAVLQVDENAPLTEEEKEELVKSCHGTSRQINLGWDGWGPNYVALVHSYWKRARVCKIKCKGVVTLDMDSLCKFIEVETGGKVVHRVGGSVYVFRGRNYEYWRAAQKLVVHKDYRRPLVSKQVPGPFKPKEEIDALRARGRELPALCKLGKNGVYLTLLHDLRKAFKTQDLVRVNCQGFHGKNLKILGLQLQALVPCEIISYEFEHILMWRNNDQTSPSDKPMQKQPEERFLFSEVQS